MRLKPRSTVLNPRALVYKRFISIEKTLSLNSVYLTYDSKYWVFDQESLEFLNVDEQPSGVRITTIPNSTTYLSYGDNYFAYIDNAWTKLSTSTGGVTLLNASFNNIGKYQMNRYYYVGSFDYMIRGSIEGITTQQIKGNITPLTSFNIKYFNDDIKLDVDDLIVINGKLFSVENPETTQKRQPKAFNIHFATLNSIL